MSYYKLIKSGSLLELYTYEKAPPHNSTPKWDRLPRKRRTSSRSHQLGYRSRANLRQSRKAFVRLVRTNITTEGSPCLLTLTSFRVVSLKRGYQWYTAFIKKLRRTYGGRFRAIAVPEFQKKGRIHFHVLIWGLYDFTKLENAEEDIKVVVEYRISRILQPVWAHGYVDCVFTDGSPKLAGYLGKYMSKAMQDTRITGEKGYSGTRNCLRPVSFGTEASPDFMEEIVDEIIGVDNLATKDKDFDTMWLGRANYKSFDV